jgi:hypothetical protein
MNYDRPINIHSKNELVDLEPSRYRIYALGGFGVKLRQFSISFKHTETGELIQCKRSFWPVQTFAFGKRAKRIFVFDIQKEGSYEVLFENPTSLKIKHSNLPISSIFSKPMANEEIEILISKKIGVYPILKRR